MDGWSYRRSRQKSSCKMACNKLIYVCVCFATLWCVCLVCYIVTPSMQITRGNYFLIFGQVTTPLLKFMAEFVFNKSQRLTFDSSSPNGILLFREVSKLIVAYGTGVMALPTPTDSYSFKYKGIWIMLTILTRGIIWIILTIKKRLCWYGCQAVLTSSLSLWQHVHFCVDHLHAYINMYVCSHTPELVQALPPWSTSSSVRALQYFM